MEQTVRNLLQQAEGAKDAPAAVNYTQAALNAAHALRVLAETPKENKD